MGRCIFLMEQNRAKLKINPATASQHTGQEEGR